MVSSRRNSVSVVFSEFGLCLGLDLEDSVSLNVTSQESTTFASNGNGRFASTATVPTRSPWDWRRFPARLLRAATVGTWTRRRRAASGGRPPRAGQRRPGAGGRPSRRPRRPPGPTASRREAPRRTAPRRTGRTRPRRPETASSAALRRVIVSDGNSQQWYTVRSRPPAESAV